MAHRLLHFGHHFHLLDEMGAQRPFLLKEPRFMTATHEKERTLTKQIGREVATALPGVEVLAVELSAPDCFTVFVDHAEGVDHALCARVTDVLRGYLGEYAVEVSSPGIERPLRRPEHFRNAVGRTVTLRTPERKRLKGEIVSAGENSVVVQSGNNNVEIPYETIVRGNLVYTDFDKGA
jgi:ribosome maturation factor RimP